MSTASTASAVPAGSLSPTGTGVPTSAGLDVDDIGVGAAAGGVSSNTRHPLVSTGTRTGSLHDLAWNVLAGTRDLAGGYPEVAPQQTARFDRRRWWTPPAERSEDSSGHPS